MSTDPFEDDSRWTMLNEMFEDWQQLPPWQKWLLYSMLPKPPERS